MAFVDQMKGMCRDKNLSERTIRFCGLMLVKNLHQNFDQSRMQMGFRLFETMKGGSKLSWCKQ